MDSGLRRAAPGLLPSRRIQNFLSINDGEGNENIFIISLHNRPSAGVTPWIVNRFRLVLSSSALKIKRLAPAPAETGVFLIAVTQYVTDL